MGAAPSSTAPASSPLTRPSYRGIGDSCERNVGCADSLRCVNNRCNAAGLVRTSCNSSADCDGELLCVESKFIESGFGRHLVCSLHGERPLSRTASDCKGSLPACRVVRRAAADWDAVLGPYWFSNAGCATEWRQLLLHTHGCRRRHGLLLAHPSGPGVGTPCSRGVHIVRSAP